jgi:hypothetical protein
LPLNHLLIYFSRFNVFHFYKTLHQNQRKAEYAKSAIVLFYSTEVKPS